MTEENYKPYVSFHNHTSYSFYDALTEPKELFQRAKELGQPAVVVTDHGTLAGLWDCLKESRKTGVKLIAGCEFNFVEDVADNDARIRHLILVAKNSKGYKNLLLASKIGYDNKKVVFKRVIPRIDWDILKEHKDGLICTTACGSGILSQLINNKQIDEAKKAAIKLKDIFGDDLAIEIQPHALRRNANLHSDYVEQTYTNKKLIEIAKDIDVKIIATTDSHYLNKEDWKAHDVMLAMGSGQPVSSGARLKYNVNDFYVKSGDEVFDKLARKYGNEFAQTAIDNTIYFADKCEFPNWIEPKFSNPSGKELPEFPVQNQKDYDKFQAWLITSKEGKACVGIPEDCSYLRYWCYQSLNVFGYGEGDKKIKAVERIKEELDVLEYHGFSSYMLITADILEFARNKGIRLGPGRGSVGGSLIAYLLEIHIADPFKHDLIFARFHNKEKVEFPDIDNDFASIRRHEVIDYVKKKYGEEYVAQVGNVTRLTPKPFIKAIARTFLYGGDRKEAVAIGTLMADIVPSPTHSGITTIEKALEKCPLFLEYTKKYTELADYAMLSGRSINWSTHAAGFVIGKRPLPGLVPLRRDDVGDIVLEFEKKRTEQSGLVKIDFLGLETLDIIDVTRQLILENGKSPPQEPFNYYQYDKKTYDMISNGNVLGIFQLGKSAGESLCRSIKPKSIEDLAIINALIRPSAKDIREDFVKARNGELDVKLTHPSLERAFKPTYGFGVFEECLMYLAEDVPKWSQNEADRLRKMTKDKGKDPDKVKQWRKQFIEDCVTNGGIDKKIATKIWDKDVAKFGGYAFNKSHAVLYSLTGFETAYYKANFPLEFMVANLMFAIKKGSVKEDYVASIKENIRRNDVSILPPDVNTSEMTYKIVNDNILMTGIDALKFMGNDAIPEIISKRPFSTFEEFLTKCDGKKVKAPAVQALAACGALDSFNMPRRQMFLYASDFKKKLKVHNDKKKKDPLIKPFVYPWPNESEWDISEIYAIEKKYLGEGLSGNKIDVYKGFFTSLAVNYSNLHIDYPEATREEINKNRDRYKIRKLEGEIKWIFEFKVKNENSNIFGQDMARIGLEDPYGNQMAMVCFPDGLDLIKERFKDFSSPGNVYKFDEPGTGIKVNGSISWYEGDISIIFDDLVACCHPPALPSDIKEKKKISMRIPKTRKKKAAIDSQILLEEVEAELAEEGFADLDDLDD